MVNFIVGRSWSAWAVLAGLLLIRWVVQPQPTPEQDAILLVWAIATGAVTGAAWSDWLQRRAVVRRLREIEAWADKQRQAPSPN